VYENREALMVEGERGVWVILARRAMSVVVWCRAIARSERSRKVERRGTGT